MFCIYTVFITHDVCRALDSDDFGYSSIMKGIAIHLKFVIFGLHIHIKINHIFWDGIDTYTTRKRILPISYSSKMMIICLLVYTVIFEGVCSEKSGFIKQLYITICLDKFFISYIVHSITVQSKRVAFVYMYASHSIKTILIAAVIVTITHHICIPMTETHISCKDLQAGGTIFVVGYTVGIFYHYASTIDFACLFFYTRRHSIS